jgi:hypothetical protein
VSAADLPALPGPMAFHLSLESSLVQTGLRAAAGDRLSTYEHHADS